MKTATMWQVGLAAAAVAMLYVHRRRRQALCFRQRLGPELAKASAQFGGGAQGHARATTVAVQRAQQACGTKPFGFI